jgi:hypothetical protein
MCGSSGERTRETCLLVAGWLDAPASKKTRMNPAGKRGM